jgi:hypothetical protein
MRKSLIVAAAAASLLASSAFAAPYHDRTTNAAEVGTGAVVGTAAGVGIYDGWFGATVAGTALPTTALGAAAAGGTVGIGTVALIDAAVQPCDGFHALFGLNKDHCVNGQYVENLPRQRVIRR